MMGLRVSSVLVLSALTVVAATQPTVLKRFNAIYQFGDSISDTGNLIRENRSSGLCSSFPYGESFFGYVTGRCSDGLIMADYYAKALGLPFLNPYLDWDANFSNGADFAVAGEPALNSEDLESIGIVAEGNNFTHSTMAQQLRWFKSHLKSICSSPLECKSKLRKSLFLMEAMGGNDYNYPLGNGKSFKYVYGLVPYVIRAITDGVKEMILLGATYVVIPAIVPFGCMPNYLASANSTDPSMYDDVGCLKDYNEFSEFHNQKLLNATTQLQILYPKVTIIYADYYSAILRVSMKKSGSQHVAGGNNPYNYDSSEMCGNVGFSVCSNPKERIHWDGLHFTQQMYEYVSGWMLNHTIIPQLTQISSI